jgi:hypothetical protein
MTNTNETGEATLLKTDDLGRVRTPQARRESLLDKYERSGLSGAKFAALTGIKYSTFATWAQRRRKQQRSAPITAKPRPSVQWLEAVVDQAQSCDGQKAAGLRLQLPGGVEMAIADEKQAALAAILIRALAC